MVKILHTADLHLDSPNSGLGLAAAESVRNEQRRVFSKMMDYAAENAVDIVLISGDLFDGKYISNETKNLVRKKFAELPCPVVIAPGNHDFYSAKSPYATLRWPENVHIFRTDLIERVEIPELGCTVYGAGFTTPSRTESFLKDFSEEEFKRAYEFMNKKYMVGEKSEKQ